MASSTEEVLNHHLQSFGAGDVEGILSDYTEGAFVIAPDGSVFTSQAQMRQLYEALVSEFGKPGASFSLDQTVIQDDVAYITWSAETADNVYEFATDTFVVVDGKIRAQTLAGKITPKG